ncbi:MAG: hypothetical protein ACYS8Z_24495, partial [Planctomycetota bacterium]
MITLLPVAAAISLFLAVYMSPIPRANRKLAHFGLKPIPKSAADLKIQVGKLTYIVFSADPNTVTKYLTQARCIRGLVDRSSLAHGTASYGGGLYFIETATPPKITDESPTWFRPSLSLPSYSHLYYLVGQGKNNRSVTVTLQGWNAEPPANDRHVVYILLPRGQTALDRILNWLQRTVG